MLVVISDEIGGTDVEIIVEMFDSEHLTFHLRKPVMLKEDYEQIIKSVPLAYKKRVVLHQHHELVSKYNVKGLHLREEQRVKSEPGALKELAKDLKKRGMTFSSSFHSQEELKQFDGIFDYVFLSPVFESISKEGYKSETELKISEPLKKTKVIALGGITASNIHLLKERGFDGAAVMGAIWQSPDNAIQSFQEIKAAYEKTFINSKIH